MTETLLSVRDLKVSYQVGKGSIDAVDGASFDVPRGSIVGLVGESGCGKTTVARALTRVIADNASITGGQILFDGQDIAALPEREMNALRWRDIAFIPQRAMNSLDPVYTVEYQLNEVLRRRGGLRRWRHLHVLKLRHRGRLRVAADAHRFLAFGNLDFVHAGFLQHLDQFFDLAYIHGRYSSSERA